MTPNHDWQEILRAAHNHPLDPAHYTAVRARVLAELERTRRPWRRLAWLWTTIAIALLIAVLYPLPRPALPALPRIAYAPPAPSLKPPSVAQVAARLAPRRHREPITIKLQTSDPNIVIYWIAD